MRRRSLDARDDRRRLQLCRDTSAPDCGACAGGGDDASARLARIYVVDMSMGANVAGGMRLSPLHFAESYANCRHAQRTPANCTHAEYTPRNGGYVSLPPAATAGGFFVQGGRDFIDAVSAGLGRLCRAPRNAERSNACTTIDQVDPPRDDPVVVLRQVFRDSSAPTAGRRCRQYTLAPALSFPTQRHPINASKRASFCYGPD